MLSLSVNSDAGSCFDIKPHSVNMLYTKIHGYICIQSKVIAELVIWAIIAPPHGSLLFQYSVPNRVILLESVLH